MITLQEFNTISETEAHTQLEYCCVSKTWIAKMLQNRPFDSEQDLINTAASIWYNECNTEDFKAAFTGHPKIGDLESLRQKFAHTKDWASDEQAKVMEADEAIIQALANANAVYEEKFGYIFIVSASGKTASEMLAMINARLRHSLEDEMYVAMNEQHKITVIRLAKMITGLKEKADLSSAITTHALDTSVGIPAANLCIVLKAFRDGVWTSISLGITNNDGRIPDVLAPGIRLQAGNYMMVFYTESYFKAMNQQGFYPEVSVRFTITDESHYHIPLLLNPFGYTTYRGS